MRLPIDETTIVLLAVAAGICVAAGMNGCDARADEPAEAQFLMVDENGNIVPEGYTLGIDQIAQAAASVATASNRAVAVAEAVQASQEIVEDVTEVLVGTQSYGYIDGFVVSLGGAAAVSTNAACRIVKFEAPSGVAESVGGVDYAACEIYYYFTEPMNSTPYIKWKTALTNETWEVVELQDIQYIGSGTIDGVPYSNLYHSTAYIPASLASAFFLAYCEVSAADGDGSMLPIWGGIKINGIDAFTGSVTNGGFEFVYQGGLLMAAPREVEEEEEEEE